MSKANKNIKKVLVTALLSGDPLFNDLKHLHIQVAKLIHKPHCGMPDCYCQIFYGFVFPLGSIVVSFALLSYRIV